MIEESHDPYEACTRLIEAFAYYIDHHQYDRAIDLFTENAVFDRPDGKREGKDAIAMLWENRSENITTRHLFYPPFFINISPERAETVTQCLLYKVVHHGDGTPKVDSPLGIAEYTDSFVKTTTGWKFINKKVTPIILQS